VIWKFKPDLLSLMLFQARFEFSIVSPDLFVRVTPVPSPPDCVVHRLSLLDRQDAPPLITSACSRNPDSSFLLPSPVLPNTLLSNGELSSQVTNSSSSLKSRRDGCHELADKLFFPVNCELLVFFGAASRSLGFDNSSMIVSELRRQAFLF